MRSIYPVATRSLIHAALPHLIVWMVLIGLLGCDDGHRHGINLGFSGVISCLSDHIYTPNGTHNHPFEVLLFYNDGSYVRGTRAGGYNTPEGVLSFDIQLLSDRIVYVVYDKTMGVDRLEMVWTGGLGNKTLLETPPWSGNQVFDPRFDPSGRYISLVYYDRAAGLDQIWYISRDGSFAEFIAEGPYLNSPCWSPGAEAIFFASADPIDGGIYRAPLNQPVLEAISIVPVNHMDLSRDGRWIVFENSYHEIYVMDSRGSRLEWLASGYDPSWSPDTRSVTFWRYPLNSRLPDVYFMDITSDFVYNMTVTAGISELEPRWTY